MSRVKYPVSSDASESLIRREGNERGVKMFSIVNEIFWSNDSFARVELCNSSREDGLEFLERDHRDDFESPLLEFS